MQYVFLIRSSAGCKKYVTRRSRVTYFLQPARIKNTYCMGKRSFLFLLVIYMRFLTIFYEKKHGTLLYCLLRQWASLSMVRVLRFSQTDGVDSVWCISILSDFLSYYAWTLVSYWLLFTACVYKLSPALTNWCIVGLTERRVIFLTTYFRTTPMADVKLASLVTDTPIVYSTVRN